MNQYRVRIYEVYSNELTITAPTEDHARDLATDYDYFRESETREQVMARFGGKIVEHDWHAFEEVDRTCVYKLDADGNELETWEEEEEAPDDDPAL